jgi:hypothetical protein
MLLQIPDDRLTSAFRVAISVFWDQKKVSGMYIPDRDLELELLELLDEPE